MRSAWLSHPCQIRWSLWLWAKALFWTSDQGHGWILSHYLHFQWLFFNCALWTTRGRSYSLPDPPPSWWDKTAANSLPALFEDGDTWPSSSPNTLRTV